MATLQPSIDQRQMANRINMARGISYSAQIDASESNPDGIVKRIAIFAIKTVGVVAAAFVLAVLIILGVATGGLAWGIAAFVAAIFFVSGSPFLAWGTAPKGSAFRP